MAELPLPDYFPTADYIAFINRVHEKASTRFFIDTAMLLDALAKDPELYEQFVYYARLQNHFEKETTDV